MAKYNVTVYSCMNVILPFKLLQFVTKKIEILWVDCSSYWHVCCANFTL